MIFAPLPAAPVQALLAAAARAIWQRHPQIFGRLKNDSSILIDPLDLPWRFLVSPGRTPPALEFVGRNSSPRADATIRAPLSALIELLEGRVDGDALFFSRDLVIEGDTEAIVELRNAVDSADIRIIEDTLAPLGPLAGPASRLCRGLFRLTEGAAARIERMAATIDVTGRVGA